MTRWLLLGLAGFLAILVVRLPAAWFAGQLPGQIRCEGLGGTVWHGDCDGMSIDQGLPNRAPLGIDALQWTLHPAAMLRGRVSADDNFTGSWHTRVEDDRRQLPVQRPLSMVRLL
jgi:hypothetical protein